MASLQTRPQRLGDVVKAELWMDHGYENSTETVLVASGMEVGTVVKSDGDGTYSTVVAADVATLPADIAIVVDNVIYEEVGVTVGQDNDILVMKGGPGASGAAVVVREGLLFGDALSSGQVDTVVAQLQAQGIKVATRIG